ncbi:AMP-binding protein [Actinokineospora iranica]|uniref:Acyl-CoA synthetase (AMP-forming)/AMP-acid ligase II n=1 Tax=Actinokineospora iranica TaxID=1271860 RepID=A0A1G6ITA8_9PSEU|nr:AMP-binding protein [Actinokineospora iranica]SDC09802.1 Acyl-CoA synthetase (AMP-forming)/AMP-acid ligase II [Actinokineospora iranica]
MPTELVEVELTLDHTPEQVWEVLSEPALYPRFVREIASADRAGGTPVGRGARYRVRFCVAGRAPVPDEIEILVHRPAEHLVLVGPRWAGGHLSIRLTPQGRGRSLVQVVVSLPEGVTAGTVLTAPWLRKRIRKAIARVEHHLSGRPITVSPTRIDQAARRQSVFSVTRTLVRAGVLVPGRPDRVARQLGALARWGPTIVGGYRAAAARKPGAVAVIDERGTLTFAEIDARTTRLANGLAEYGVRTGRRVAVMCRNHAGLVEATIACGKLGADVLMLNTGISADQVADLIEAHRPIALLADDEFAPLFHNLPATLPWISTWSAAPGEVTVDGLIEDAPDTPLRAPSTAGKIIVMTSGTTGTPKGARRRNPQGLGAAASVLSRIPLRNGERMLVAAPLFHTWGLAALQLGMPLHATLALHRRFDAEATLAAIAELKCTTLIAVPVMLQRILALPERVRARYDVSSLRVVASSGSALPGPFVTEFMDTFGDILYNLYGSTEVSWASIADPADLRAAPTTAGRCPVGTKVGILDADGDPLPPGVVGRICVGNEMLFEGYTNGTRNEMHDDLMVTGDRGYLDADGRLFVSGRDDDMIVSGGENVFPRPVEELLLNLDGVQDAAVVGVPDHEYGQRFAAYVALKPGARLGATAVQEYIHDHLERFSVPRDVFFVRKVPRNATGKVVKRLLVDQD